MVVMEDVTMEERSAELYVSVHGGFRVAEVVRGHGGPPPKSLDSDENFKPEHTLFCHALFGDN